MQTVYTDINQCNRKAGKANHVAYTHRPKKVKRVSKQREKYFADRIVTLISDEYPRSKEEASVLLSRVWVLIEDEIRKDLKPSVTREYIRERISAVSALYDLAVEKLRRLNKPLLRQGAVADFYASV
jgi:hypothetical protein